MLQKIKYETLEFGKYEKLRKIFLSNDFEPKEVKELDLMGCQSDKLPHIRCLKLLPNLLFLHLDNNLINSFDAKIITTGCPQLVSLNLCANNI